MTSYETNQGDMFDQIAFHLLGNVKYTAAIIKENPEHRLTQHFPSGVTLVIPDVEETETDTLLPPWKKAAT